MSDITIRPLHVHEQREAYELAMRAYHLSPTDSGWKRWLEPLSADRRFGAFLHGTLAGVISAFSTELTVPGGRTLTVAATGGAAVRADYSRRGVLTALMQEQLRDCAERGEKATYGWGPTSATLYGRYGSGIATNSKNVHITSRNAIFRNDTPTGGAVRMLRNSDAIPLIQEIYQSAASYRPGMIRRPTGLWPDDLGSTSSEHNVAVHTGPQGDDGFVLYRPVNFSHDGPNLQADLFVDDLHTTNPHAMSDLWRFLTSIDLTSEIYAPMRPIDEFIDLMLIDPRQYRVGEVQDHTLLRILDVLEALAARSYRRAKPVVMGIVDRLFPENDGNYRISSQGVERTGHAAQVRMGVETLAMIYLGAWSPSTLAIAGRINVLDAEAISAADELFRPTTAPWCGTSF
ncbi:GNAT family N-acetyltransferase [Phytoactinopolyspora mesophila]|nr:GNAT family N-acetyltransferase [Phytoactinopolyspora mesophila]